MEHIVICIKEIVYALSVAGMFIHERCYDICYQIVRIIFEAIS